MSGANEVLATIAGIFVSITTISGVLLWLVVPRFKQWAMKNLGQPVQEIHQQTTVNGGRNNPPTLPDQLSSIRKELVELRKNDERRDETVDALAMVLDEHLRWSREYVARHDGNPPSEP